MRQFTTDPCLLMRYWKGKLDGLVALQVDDSLSLGSSRFLHDEEATAVRFKTKPHTLLGRKPITFNGTTIERRDDNVFVTSQPDKVYKLALPGTKAEFASNKALAQYVGFNVRLDICTPTQLVAPGSTVTTATEQKTLSHVIGFLRETREDGL